MGGTYQFDGMTLTKNRLDSLCTQVAEEINVKAVIFNLDDGRSFWVEHDPVRNHHKVFVSNCWYIADVSTHTILSMEY